MHTHMIHTILACSQPDVPFTAERGIAVATSLTKNTGESSTFHTCDYGKQPRIMTSRTSAYVYKRRMYTGFTYIYMYVCMYICVCVCVCVCLCTTYIHVCIMRMGVCILSYLSGYASFIPVYMWMHTWYVQYLWTCAGRVQHTQVVYVWLDVTPESHVCTQVV